MAMQHETVEDCRARGGKVHSILAQLRTEKKRPSGDSMCTHIGQEVGLAEHLEESYQKSRQSMLERADDEKRARNAVA